MNPTEQGLTSLSERDAVLSLWYHHSTLENVFFSQKITKKEKKKKNTDICWENKEQKIENIKAETDTT